MIPPRMRYGRIEWASATRETAAATQDGSRESANAGDGRETESAGGERNR